MMQLIPCDLPYLGPKSHDSIVGMTVVHFKSHHFNQPSINSGGTNFGFISGAKDGEKFEFSPAVTSFGELLLRCFVFIKYTLYIVI